MLDEAFTLREDLDTSFDGLYDCLIRRYRSYAERRHTAGKEGLPVNPNIPRDSYFGAFCMDNAGRLGIRSIVKEFAIDRKSGRKRRNWDRIAAGRYENALLQYADETKRQMMRPGPVLDMLDVICGNVLDMIALKTLQIRLDMDVSSHYVEDALYYDIFDSNDCVDVFVDCFNDKSVCGDFDDAYDLFQEMKEWAEFGEGQYTSDYATLYAMSLAGNCPADPDVDQAIVCLNRCLDIFHGSGDVSLAFIDGGIATLNRVRYANSNDGMVYTSNNYFYDEPVPGDDYEKVRADVKSLLQSVPYARDRRKAAEYVLSLIRKTNKGVKSDIASNALAKKKFKDLVEDVMRYLQNRRYYGDEYVRDAIFGVLWFRMKKYEGKTK